MYKINLCRLFFIFFSICMIYAKNDTEVTMIAEVLRDEERPINVVSLLCWFPSKVLKMLSLLSQENTKKMITLILLNSNEMPMRYTRKEEILFLIDLRCPNISDFIQESIQNDYFRSPFRWIFLSDANNTVTPDTLFDAEILIDSEVLLIIKGNENTYEAYYIYKVNSQSNWRKDIYGYWSEEHGIQRVNSHQSLTLQRLNLEGIEITMSYVLTDPDSKSHLTDGVDDHIDTITKANFRTTNHLLDYLNATRRYIFTNTWGYRVNGSWTGMTGLMVRNEVEIGGSPMFLTSERTFVVEYISSPTPSRSKFVFQQPKLSYENNLFLLSFRTNVWYSSIALVFLLFLSLFLVAVWEWKKYPRNDETKLSTLRPSVGEIIVLIFGATCQQGSPVELKGGLGRTVMLILFFALMFLYTSYSANIVALLQSSSTQIKTLEDLLHSRLKFGVHDNIFNRYYFSTTIEPTRKAIYLTKVAPPGVKPGFMTMDEGVKNMKKGLFAFHMEIGVGYKFVGKYFHESEKCGLKEIQYLQVIDPWLAVRKNTPFLEMYKIGLKRIQEHGLQSRENHIYYEKKPKCSGRVGNFVSVSMVDCYPAVLILTYGVIVSLGMLLTEVLWIKRASFLKR